MSYQYEACEGTLEGLYLPCLAWAVLRREDIQTRASDWKSGPWGLGWRDP
jgi:hypothetical protein